MITENRIRQRKSYLEFQEWFIFLQTKPTNQQILRKIYTLLDKKATFGSQTNAIYAEESLDLLIKDKKIK